MNSPIETQPINPDSWRDRACIAGVAILLGLYLLLTSTTAPLPELDIYNGKRLLQCLMAPLLMLLVLASPAIRTGVSRVLEAGPAYLWLALAVIFALGLVSGLRHPQWTYSLADIGLYAWSIALVVCVAGACLSETRLFLRITLAMLTLLGLAVAVQESMGFLVGLHMGNPFRMELMFAYFAHPRFYNQVQSWSLPLLAALPLLFGRRPGIIGLAVVLAGLQWCLLLASGGRGSMVGLVTATVLCTLLFIRVRPTRWGWPSWMGWHLGGLACGLLLFAALLWGQGQISQSDANQNLFREQSLDRYSLPHSSGRDTLWRIAFQLSTDEPLLGIGPARYACYSIPGLGAHPHSFPMQMLAEWGWPASLLLVGVLAWLGWRLLRLAIPQLSPTASEALNTPQEQVLLHRELLQVFTCGVLAAAGHACFSGVLVMPASQTLGAWVGGCLLGLALGAAAPAPVPSSPAASGPVGKLASPLTSLVCIFALALALAQATFAIRQLPAGEMSEDYVAPAEMESPRFWQNGAVCGTQRIFVTP